jgi:ATP-dependent Clp protease ATP-binding subunit ClpB
LERVRKRLADRELRLELDESAKSYLAREGYDPHFGARPLKRAIQEHLLDPVALRLLDGTFAAGDEIRVSAGDSGLQLEKS